MDLLELLDIFIMLTRQLQDDHIDDDGEAEHEDNDDGDQLVTR